MVLAVFVSRDLVYITWEVTLYYNLRFGLGSVGYEWVSLLPV